MKHGVLYFLNLSKISFISRICVLPFMFLIGVSKSSSTMLPISIVLFAVALIFAVIPAPPENAARTALEGMDKDFSKHLHAEYLDVKSCECHVLKCFSKVGRMIMRKTLDGEVVYPHPAILASVKSEGVISVEIATLSLMKDGDASIRHINGNDIGFSLSDDDGKYRLLTLTDKSNSYSEEFVVKWDYRLREFLGIIDAKYADMR